MAAKYPPYVNAYGNIPKLFREIRKASVPPKFTQDFLTSVLGLKSSSYRAMIPFLKRLGFLDQGNTPTEAYKQYRGDDKVAKTVMARRIRDAYSDLYAANEYAHKLSKEDLQAKLLTLTGAAEEDRNIPAVAATFLELCKLANFESSAGPVKEKEAEPEDSEEPADDSGGVTRKLGISYTINLNLPATTEIEVFNAIFKSLKEHILHEK